MSLQKAVIFVASAIFIVVYLVIRWRKTSAYVDSRKASYDEYQKYNERVKQDSRWNVFWTRLQSMHTVVETATADKDAYRIHCLKIMDVNDPTRLFEPNEPGSETASMIAYLKRESNPKYLSITMAPNGEMHQMQLSGLQWHALQETPY